MANSYVTTTAWLPSSTSQSHLLIGLTNADLKTSTVQALITRREAFVNSFLSQKYTVPISTSAMVTMVVEDLVTYDIWKLLVGRDGVVDQSITDQYTISLNTLDGIAKGNLTIILDSGTELTEKDISTRCWVNNKGYTPTFNVDDPTRWKVSPKRLSDISQDRDSDV